MHDITNEIIIYFVIEVITPKNISTTNYFPFLAAFLFSLVFLYVILSKLDKYV